MSSSYQYQPDQDHLKTCPDCREKYAGRIKYASSVNIGRPISRPKPRVLVKSRSNYSRAQKLGALSGIIIGTKGASSNVTLMKSCKKAKLKELGRLIRG